MKMRRKILVLLAILGLGHTALQGQALVPEELPYGKPAVLLRAKSNRLWCVQLWSETTEGMSFLISFRNGGNWKNLPLLRLARAGNRSASINDIEILGNRIYVAGNFIVPGSTRNCLLYFDQNSSTWKSDLEFTQTPAPGMLFPVVHTLYNAGNVLYAGGIFTKAGNLECQNLLKIELKGFALRQVKNNSVTGASGPVNQILPDSSGKQLYIAGAFKRILGQGIQGLALFSLADSTVSGAGKGFNNVIRMGVSGSHIVLVNEEDSSRYRKMYEAVSGQWTNPSNVDSVFNVGSLVVLKNESYFTGSIRVNGVRRSGLFKLSARSASLQLEKILRIELAELFNSEFYLAGPFLNNITQNQEPFAVARLATDLFRIAGRVFYDKNQNGKFDLGELRLSGRLVKVSPTGHFIPTDRNGLFTFLGLAKSTAVYTFTVSGMPGEFAAPVSRRVKGDSAPDFIIDFPMQFSRTNYRDFRVSLTSAGGNRSRRDTSEYYYLTLENTGTMAGSTNLELNYNNKLVKVTPDLGPNQIDPGKLTWNNINLDAGEEKSILIKMTAPSSDFSIQQSFAISASISAAQDDNSDNDQDSLVQTVSSGIAPIAKFQNPAPASPADTFAWYDPSAGKIDYTIRFTNTGSDTLDYVVVRDTVSTPSWVTYIQETGNSHPFSRNVYTNPSMPNKVILVYTFSNLRLPPNPSGNPEVAASSGFISFRLGISNAIPNGTALRNRAVVYMENASSVLTNTVVAKTALSHVLTYNKRVSEMLLFPNPGSGQFQISGASDGDQIRISSIEGRLMQTAVYNGSFTTSDRLAPGIYICQVMRNGELRGQGKFILVSEK